MKRALLWVVSFILCGSLAYAEEADYAKYPNSILPIITTADAAIVMDADNGRILFAKDIEERLAMASTTKIMTALIALEQDDLEERFTVSEEAVTVEGSSMGLLPDDSVDLLTLVYGLMLPSGNDAANSVAFRIGGSIEGFAEIMNEKASELNLVDTHFVTPSGLDADGHYTTAKDLANLTREAMKNEIFKEIVAMEYAVVEYGNPPYERGLKNYNQLLEMYEGANGVKTGLTDNAGRCLVSSASRNGVNLIVVTLDCKNDYEVHSLLYDTYFAELISVDMEDVIGEIEIPIMGSEEVVSTALLKEPNVAIYPDEVTKINISYKLPQTLFAPISYGDYLGVVQIRADDVVLYESAVYSASDIQLPEKEEVSILDKVMDLFD